MVVADRSTIGEVRVWLGGVAPVAFEAGDIGARLKGCAIDDASISEAVAAAGQRFPRLTKDAAIEDYRHDLATVLIADTVTNAAHSAKA